MHVLTRTLFTGTLLASMMVHVLAMSASILELELPHDPHIDTHAFPEELRGELELLHDQLDVMLFERCETCRDCGD